MPIISKWFTIDKTQRTVPYRYESEEAILTFQKNLKKVLELCHLTIDELATITGYSRKSISFFLNGKMNLRKSMDGRNRMIVAIRYAILGLFERILDQDNGSKEMDLYFATYEVVFSLLYP